MKKVYLNGRKADTAPLKECIEEFLKNTKLNAKFQETRVSAMWEKIVGRTIASRTTELFVKNQVLYLKLNSSSLRSELSMGKQKLVQLINNEIGEEVVKDIVFI
ncbi:MAG: DUF721 domain-containing protein [Cytophagaceae bacterium]